jgi:hypothetical protein
MSSLGDWALPKLFRIEAEALVCGSCGRKWRVASYWGQPALNQEYLIEHALLHSKVRRRRLPLTSQCTLGETEGRSASPPVDTRA